jgi:hypothetical protein
VRPDSRRVGHVVTVSLVSALQSFSVLSRSTSVECVPLNILDGAAATVATARRNTTVFDGLKLIPRCIVDVTRVDTATRIFGQVIQWPVYCAPKEVRVSSSRA